MNVNNLLNIIITVSNLLNITFYYVNIIWLIYFSFLSIHAMKYYFKLTPICQQCHIDTHETKFSDILQYYSVTRNNSIFLYFYFDTFIEVRSLMTITVTNVSFTFSFCQESRLTYSWQVIYVNLINQSKVTVQTQ